MSANRSDVQTLYSPSEWSKRLPAGIICDKHIEFITQNSEKSKKLLQCELNIPYGPGKREVFDLYGTNLPDDSPILIHIHGGYWSMDDFTHSNNGFAAINLHKNGIKSIVIGYELCPKVTMENISKNLCVAFSKCLEYAKKMRARGIYLSGHSAGAQLTASLFHTFIPFLPKDDQKLFKSAYLVSGVYDLLPLMNTTVNEPLKLDETRAKLLSPIYQKLSSEGTCFYVMVAQYDSPAFKEQAKGFTDYLISLGFKTKFVLIKNTDHFDVVENLVRDDYELTKLIINDINNQRT